MALLLRAAAVLLSSSLLVACGGSEAPETANAGAGASSGGTAKAPVSVEDLLAQANAALQAKRLFDPAEDNAMALFLEVSERKDAVDDGAKRRRLMESVGAGDPQQQAQLAMNDLLPYGLTRVEQ